MDWRRDVNDAAAICLTRRPGALLAPHLLEAAGLFVSDQKPGRVASRGEVRMSSGVLKDAFGRKGLQLRTDDGRLLRLQFSEKRLGAASDAAHVDVAGELPAESEWRH